MLHDGNRAASRVSEVCRPSGHGEELALGALARLGLARAYAMQGNNAKARAAYQDFLALWKNADPDIPLLQRANPSTPTCSNLASSPESLRAVLTNFPRPTTTFGSYRGTATFIDSSCLRSSFEPDLGDSSPRIAPNIQFIFCRMTEISR